MKRTARGECDGRVGVPSPVSPTPDVQSGWRGFFQLSVERAIRCGIEQLLTAQVWLLGFGHLVLFVVIYWLAFLLRFGFAVPPGSMHVFWLSLPWVLGTKLAVFWTLGHYHGWWRHVTFADLSALLRASALSLLALAALDHFIFPYQIPRAILILDCTVGIVLLGSLRSSWRLLEDLPILNSRNCRRALLVGAGHSSGYLAHEIHSHPELQYRIKGFLATDGEKKGVRLGQIPVLGRLEDIGEIAAIYGTPDVLVTAGSLPGPRLRHLVETCNEGGLNLKIIPAAGDLYDGDQCIPIRDIDINDLLRRDPVELDTTTIEELLKGRRVMVTGAGGSIGSEICRQIMRFNPESLVLVGRGENRIFHIDGELRLLCTPSQVHPSIADITDRDRMQQLLRQHRPEVIFHAAAHKHVPLMECNVGEAVKNNVCGTRCLADLAHEFGVGSFVLVSTDKVVNPCSVMGASKHLAERYVHTLSQESTTRFVVTRFGNVLGSTGSVVPIFREQIRHGGPITVTDPRMMRYFMTIPEAAQLVLQAAALGRGGEIFVLEMGEPVRIVDLAHDLIRLSGLPEDAIEIVFTGVRPGEKLYEELYFDAEEMLETSHPKLRAAYHRPYSLAEVRQEVSELAELAGGPEEVIRQKLQEMIPEYRASAPRGPEVETQASQMPLTD